MASAEEIRRINPLVPQTAKVARVVAETPDVMTLCLEAAGGGLPFTVRPGQLAMVSVFGAGEAMFSLTQGDDHLELSVKKIGEVTGALHTLVPGRIVGIRGPYGNGFPLEDLRGRDIVFVAGGIGLAPLRSLIRWCLERRRNFGRLHLVYGARTPAELVFKEELFGPWPAAPAFAVSVTVDRGDSGWAGHVGLVPEYLRELAPSPEAAAVVCGPPVMIRYTLPVLAELGFDPSATYTTLEMRMKCGIGKCGRCNIGSCYVCLDGPVFSMAELRQMPAEY